MQGQPQRQAGGGFAGSAGEQYDQHGRLLDRGGDLVGGGRGNPGTPYANPALPIWDMNAPPTGRQHRAPVAYVQGQGQQAQDYRRMANPGQTMGDFYGGQPQQQQGQPTQQRPNLQQAMLQHYQRLYGGDGGGSPLQPVGQQMATTSNLASNVRS